MIAYHRGPEISDWLRLAGVLILALGALLAVIALVFLYAGPDGRPFLFA